MFGGTYSIMVAEQGGEKGSNTAFSLVVPIKWLRTYVRTYAWAAILGIDLHSNRHSSTIIL